VKTIAFFNHKGGVGKTSLVYHLAWMYDDLGLRVVAADLDPQANLTSMFLDEARLEALWSKTGHRETIFGALQPLLEGTGDVASPHVEDISDGIGLLAGDLALLSSEDELNRHWADCVDHKPRALQVLSGISRVIEQAGRQREAQVALIDVAPATGAINRAALIAAEFVVIPLMPDVLSMVGLRNLGPTLRRWRSEWSECRTRNPSSDLLRPDGAMKPVGYVLVQPEVNLSHQVNACRPSIAEISDVYREAVLEESGSGSALPAGDDPQCLAVLKHYGSLMALAHEARKPMFFLKPADGAIGGQVMAVQDCYSAFRGLAKTIAERCGLTIPAP
jgi:chromosome partitioning protein